MNKKILGENMSKNTRLAHLSGKALDAVIEEAVIDNPDEKRSDGRMFIIEKLL